MRLLSTHVLPSSPSACEPQPEGANRHKQKQRNDHRDQERHAPLRVRFNPLQMLPSLRKIKKNENWKRRVNEVRRALGMQCRDKDAMISSATAWHTPLNSRDF